MAERQSHSTGGTILLGAVAAMTAEIVVHCRSCPRYGRLRTDRLAREHGAQMPMTDLLRFLAADCPRLKGPDPNQRCDVHCPTLSEIFSARAISAQPSTTNHIATEPRCATQH